MLDSGLTGSEMRCLNPLRITTGLMPRVTEPPCFLLCLRDYVSNYMNTKHGFKYCMEEFSGSYIAIIARLF